MAAAVTFLALLLMAVIDHFFLAGLGSWSAELAAYATVPILLAFIVLYRSAWHDNLRQGTRALLLAATSCALFGAVLFGSLLALLLAAFVYASCFDHFLAFHY